MIKPNCKSMVLYKRKSIYIQTAIPVRKRKKLKLDDSITVHSAKIFVRDKSVKVKFDEKVKTHDGLCDINHMFYRYMVYIMRHIKKYEKIAKKYKRSPVDDLVMRERYDLLRDIYDKLLDLILRYEYGQRRVLWLPKGGCYEKLRCRDLSYAK